MRWRPFQDRPPELATATRWFKNDFPDAGIALVLGPAFDLLIVDVDGAEANRVLIDRLGGIPRAPTVMSGSGDPNKFHLYFQHPPIATKAKATPWHSQLEFRGYRGIAVAVPSLHKSGHRYRWAPGLSLDDLEPPPLPPAILDALRSAQRAPRRLVRARRPASPLAGPMQGVELEEALERLAVCRKTRRFLGGEFRQGPGWNDELFRAASDLCGCGLTVDVAEPLLLAGAGPWDATERETALATIASAFSQPRRPARELAAARNGPTRCKRGSIVIKVRRR